MMTVPPLFTVTSVTEWMLPASTRQHTVPGQYFHQNKTRLPTLRDTDTHGSAVSGFTTKIRTLEAQYLMAESKARSSTLRLD